MFKIITVLMVFAITGCGRSIVNQSVTVQSESDSPKTSMLYGDSRCVDNIYIESRDCVGGRSLTDLDYINTDYDVIIIHLGFNDMFTVTPEQYGAHLAYLIHGAEYKTWCILPTWFNYHRPSSMVAEFREQMILICTNIKDPQIEGYQEDQIHYTDINYQHVYEVYQEITSPEINPRKQPH